MNVAIFASECYYPADRLSVLSVHVQLALKTAELLLHEGHNVTVLTTPPRSGHVLPIIESQDIKIVHILGSQNTGASGKSRYAKFVLGWYQIVRHIRREGYDIVHGFGSDKTGYFLSTLKLGLVPSRLIWTITASGGQEGFIKTLVASRLYNVIDSFVYSSAYMKKEFGLRGLHGGMVCPVGITKDITPLALSGKKHERSSVLFWRDSSWRNGADICVETFEILSERHPDVDFVFAVRPWHEFTESMEKLAKSRENIYVYLYPYSNGTTIESLLQDAFCVVLPFRSVSDPQYAILESMYAGVPVVTTAIGPNNDLIKEGYSGRLVPPGDIPATVKAVEGLLADREAARKMGDRGGRQVRKEWNWEKYMRCLTEVYR